MLGKDSPSYLLFFVDERIYLRCFANQFTYLFKAAQKTSVTLKPHSAIK